MQANPTYFALQILGRLAGNAAKRDHRSLPRIAWYAGLLLVNEGKCLSLHSAKFFAFCDSFSLRPVPTAIVAIADLFWALMKGRTGAGGA